ncbi:hypothetical protein JAO73_16765 [Hymenobacter sp. BT523]|uniref:hypothetical protein n=1 Tax=Hymenobacter sp. BT523 TaxID=2795725 RepID=UPI0018EB89A1|nr:hypothetical protein [Hymenobacter sp. BT523]MBJ6110678.1 hypothetical protein [Hymenobacter sp. BT523]
MRLTTIIASATNVLSPFKLLCAIALLLGSLIAHAQAPSTAGPPPVAPTTAAATLTRADTARAIRKLFKSRRGGGIGWLAFGTAGILASTLPAQQSTSAGVWTPGVVAGSAFMLIGLNKRIQFRPGRERQVLRELAATGHVRPSVARRLRGNFAPEPGSADDYNPLLAKDIYTSTPTTPLTPAQLQENARADTLRAISRLFERRRKGGKIWTYVGVSGALALVRALTAPSTNGNSVDGGGVAVLAGGFVVAPVVLGVLNLSAYSEAREAEVDQLYRAGRPLPKKIRQRLKKKDLEPYD